MELRDAVNPHPTVGSDLTGSLKDKGISGRWGLRDNVGSEQRSVLPPTRLDPKQGSQSRWMAWYRCPPNPKVLDLPPGSTRQRHPPSSPEKQRMPPAEGGVDHLHE